MTTTERRSQRRFVLATTLWAAALLFGGLGLSAYSTRAGPRAAVPAAWPESLGERPRGLRMLLFAHPHCPCTRATLVECAQLLASSQGQLEVDVWFLLPAQEDPAWAATDLWEFAESAPGMCPRLDVGGELAARMGAETSGHCLVYDADGRLRFDGGLTWSRGHQGASAGTEAIESLLARRADLLTQTPVFGCGLAEPESETETEACTR